MRIAKLAAAATLAAAVVATAPASAGGSATEAAGQQIQILLNHAPALQADLLHVVVEGQTVYIHGTVESQIESSQVDSLIGSVVGAHIVNSTEIVGGVS